MATALEAVRKISANSPPYHLRFTVFPKFICLSLLHYITSIKQSISPKGFGEAVFCRAGITRRASS
jgi:hypothetical protein